MMKISPMLARMSNKPVSRYFPRNCKAAMAATLREPDGNFNPNHSVASVCDRRPEAFAQPYIVSRLRCDTNVGALFRLGAELIPNCRGRRCLPRETNSFPYKVPLRLQRRVRL
jgi:hypothetical protein